MLRQVPGDQHKPVRLKAVKSRVAETLGLPAPPGPGGQPALGTPSPQDHARPAIGAGYDNLEEATASTIQHVLLLRYSLSIFVACAVPGATFLTVHLPCLALHCIALHCIALHFMSRT